MKRFLNLIRALIWPKGVRCLCCEDLIDQDLLCCTCRKGLELIRLCEEDGVLPNGRSVFRYDGVAKRMVILLKKHTCLDAAYVLAHAMLPVLQEMALPKDTIMTWVTMPEQRKGQRGFDHGYELGKALAELSGMPLKQLMTRNVAYLHTQRGLNREERLKNLAGTFVCQMGIRAPVLLIDDVMTTGATVSACSQVLLAAGAKQVYILTATRALLSDVMEPDEKKGWAEDHGLFAS